MLLRHDERMPLQREEGDDQLVFGQDRGRRFEGNNLAEDTVVHGVTPLLATCSTHSRSRDDTTGGVRQAAIVLAAARCGTILATRRITSRKGKSACRCMSIAASAA